MRTFHIFEEILKSFREQNYFRQRLVEQTFPEEKWSGSNIYNAISLCLSVCLSVSLPQHGTGVVIDGQILESSAETEQDLVSCTDVLHCRSPGS